MRNSVFADAGRRAARYAARSSALPARALAQVTPSGMGKAIGARVATNAARRVLNAALRVGADGAVAQVPSPLSIHAVPDGAACSFYGASLRRVAQDDDWFRRTDGPRPLPRPWR